MIFLIRVLHFSIVHIFLIVASHKKIELELEWNLNNVPYLFIRISRKVELGSLRLHCSNILLGPWVNMKHERTLALVVRWLLYWSTEVNEFTLDNVLMLTQYIIITTMVWLCGQSPSAITIWWWSPLMSNSSQ